jgi:hypothetical protein
MTCVIGHPNFLCADRKITADGERCPNEKKLWSNHALVVAGAGCSAKLHKIRDLVKSGATDISRFVDPLGDEAHVLVLVEGEMWEVTSGSMWRHHGLKCIGSGGDLARGYLEGRKLTRKIVGDAQKFVARIREDCGGGYDFGGTI